MSPNHEITELLRAWSNGDKIALDKLMPLLYRQLHQMARRYMRQERPEHTLQTSALINEAYLRLVDWKNVRWQNRAQFFGVSAQLMRRILVDFARSRKQAKRGGGVHPISLDEGQIVSRDRSREIVALDDALTRLAAIDPLKSQIAELRFFAGLTMDETAVVLKISVRTAFREWDLAKAWLHRELSAQHTT